LICFFFYSILLTDTGGEEVYGAKAWTDYLNMRDYLNAHEEEAMEYSRLKKELANQYPNDRKAYTNGKHDFIANILRKAKEENYSL